MQFTFTVKGGFLGIKKEYADDAANLPGEYHDMLMKLSKERSLKPDNVSGISNARDAYEYTLEFKDDENNIITLDGNDMNVLPQYKQLINFLRKKTGA